jgi:hypothetical protein
MRGVAPIADEHGLECLCETGSAAPALSERRPHPEVEQSSATDRPRPAPLAAPAPPHACGRKPTPRSCGHRCRRFLVVGAGRRQIHVLVFFQVTHGQAPRPRTWAANGNRNINSGLSSSDGWSWRERYLSEYRCVVQITALSAEPTRRLVTKGPMAACTRRSKVGRWARASLRRCSAQRPSLRLCRECRLHRAGGMALGRHSEQRLGPQRSSLRGICHDRRPRPHA